jgi:hypothetical protein
MIASNEFVEERRRLQLERDSLALTRSQFDDPMLREQYAFVQGRACLDGEINRLQVTNPKFLPKLSLPIVHFVLWQNQTSVTL